MDPSTQRRDIDELRNALMEAFWARMQVELVDRRRWLTRIELANAIFEYLEVFHNGQRRHTALDMLTPIEYERIHYHNNPNRRNADPSELTPQNRVTINR
ncbi:MAG: IS3 family transposase [Acidimicrobiia bacterium]|nr:IS3 family transposase [Acidimicrobiia bacterium]